MTSDDRLLTKRRRNKERTRFKRKRRMIWKLMRGLHNQWTLIGERFVYEEKFGKVPT